MFVALSTWIGLSALTMNTGDGWAEAANDGEGTGYCWSDALGSYSAAGRQCEAEFETISQLEFRKRREADASAAFASAYPEIVTAKNTDALNENFDMVSTGTAFFVTDDGYLVTNRHVVEGCDVMTVVGSGTLYPVLVMDTANIDLALLKASVHVDQFALFTTRPLRVGDNVYAIGYPLLGELGGIIVTDGIVSSLFGPPDQPYFLQISAPIQPGNSGGPLVDQWGTIAGVVTAKNSGLAGDVILEGVGFAIRPSLVMGLMIKNGVEPLLLAYKRLSTPSIAEFVSTFTHPVVCWVKKNPKP